MFVSCGDSSVNVAEIVRLGSGEVELRDGSTVRLKPGQRDTIALETCPVLPAQAGFELLEVYFGDPDRVVYKHQPIIAWRLEQAAPRPVVVESWDLEAQLREEVRFGRAITMNSLARSIPKPRLPRKPSWER